MSDQKLPKYFKDASGFCYVATPALASLEHLTPWDGDIDAKGFATEAPAKKPAAKKQAAAE